MLPRNGKSSAITRNKHEADHQAQAADHQLLHDRALEAEEIRERHRHVSAHDQHHPHQAVDADEIDGQPRLAIIAAPSSIASSICACTCASSRRLDGQRWRTSAIRRLQPGVRESAVCCAAVHLRPFLSITECTYARSVARSWPACGNDSRIAIDRRQRSGLFVACELPPARNAPKRRSQRTPASTA